MEMPIRQLHGVPARSFFEGVMGMEIRWFHGGLAQSFLGGLWGWRLVGFMIF